MPIENAEGARCRCWAKAAHAAARFRQCLGNCVDRVFLPAGFEVLSASGQECPLYIRSQLLLLSPTFRTARKASCGISTRPMRFMRFLPSFCFSSSLRLRLMSPP